MHDMVINDEELYRCSEEMKMFGDNIMGMQESLNIILGSIAENVFIEGNVANNLRYLCSQFEALKADMDYLVKEEKRCMDAMIEEIDVADKDIYVGE